MSADIRDQLQTTLSGSYTLERELGGGGMSRVFVADETRLGRKVVVKVLSPELAAGISGERFDREIRVAASLQQANIVPVLIAGETNGLPYYTMPFVDGESLRARLARGPLSIAEVTSILRDVSRALAYAHERGIVHRDIKPDNVLLSRGTAVVTDFGIAKALAAAQTTAHGATLTQLGTALGTPAYMAPEQSAGDPATDHRADFYAFGCMAYELLTGRLPFDAKTPQKLLAAHMSETARPVTELRPDTPLPLALLVTRCMAKDADARPQTADELLAALESTPTSDAAQPAMPAILLGGSRMLRSALAIYGAAFVIVAIVARAAIIAIGLPDWVFPGALVVMALGLPVILFTGYAQYVTRRALTATPTLTPGGSPSTTTRGTMATIAMKASPHVSWRRTALGGAYAVGAFVILVGAFMLLRALGIGPFGSLLAAGALSAQDPLLVTEFRVVRADSTLGEVISQAVRTNLEQSSAIRVAGQSTVTAALQRMQRTPTARLDLALAREVATREGIKAIVDGEIDGIGSGYLLTLRLVTADSGRELTSFREAANDPKELIGAVDVLTRKLRGRIGESLREVRASPPLAQVTTASLDALRKYTAATKATGRSDWPEAARLAREAIAIDSNFALAYRHLSESILNGRMARAGADSAIERAMRLSDRLTERERLAVIGDYYAIGPEGEAVGPGRDRVKAIAAFERQLELGEYSNTNSLGVQLATKRAFARAESIAVLRIKAQPEYSLTYGNMVQWQLAQGKISAAETSLALIRRRFPDDVRLLNLRAQLAFVHDSIGSATALFSASARGSSASYRVVALGGLAALAQLQGRMRERQQWTRERAAVDSARGADLDPLRDTLEAVNAGLWLSGALPEHVRRIDEAVASGSFSAVPVEKRPYLGVATAYGFAGRADRARAMLARYAAEVKDTTRKRYEEPNLHAALAEIALAEHRPQEAITEFQRADALPDGPANECVACLNANLARAYDALDARDSTIAAIERALAVPGVARLDIAVRVGPFEKRLGELYEAKGDRQKAATHYAKFIELWKNADPELQPKVAEVKKRLARLSDTETKR